MFEGSIRHNLTMWDNTIEEPTMIQAAKDAVIHNDIAELIRRLRLLGGGGWPELQRRTTSTAGNRAGASA